MNIPKTFYLTFFKLCDFLDNYIGHLLKLKLGDKLFFAAMVTN